MSQQPIRVAVFGAGTVGRHIIAGLHRGQADIVGVIDPIGVGTDAGELAGVGPIGVPVSDDPETLFAELDVDVAIVSVGTTLSAIESIVTRTLRNGVNVVTIAEDAYYPWANNRDRIVAEHWDALARQHRVTIVGTGIQDVIWQNLALVLSGSVTEVTEIHATVQALLDASGPVVLEAIYAGKSVEDFNNAPPAHFNEVLSGPLHALADHLGLTITDASTVAKPVIADKEHYSPVANITVAAGDVIGTVKTTTLRTAEGISLVADFVSKLAQDAETEFCRWELFGTPETSVLVERFAGDATTAAIAVNRIPDVIAADPGYRSVSDLPTPRHVRRLIR